MVLFRGDIKCKSLQRRTSISVILPADNIHFLNDMEEIVPKPYKTLYLLHGLYGSDDIFLANTSIQKFAVDHGIAIVIPCGENSFYVLVSLSVHGECGFHQHSLDTVSDVVVNKGEVMDGDALSLYCRGQQEGKGKQQ